MAGKEKNDLEYVRSVKWVAEQIVPIRKRSFTVGQIRLVSPSITYRQINHWNGQGLIGPKRPGGKVGWRRFSYFDTVTVLLIQDMRSFGLSSELIKRTLRVLHRKPKGIDADISFLELCTYWAMTGDQCVLIVPQLDLPRIVWREYLLQELDSCELLNQQYLLIPFTRLAQVAMKLLGAWFEINPVKKNIVLNPKFRKIIELIENKKYREIRITKKDNQSFTIAAVKTTKGKSSMEQVVQEISDTEFGKIEVTTKYGKIVTLCVEETCKP